MSIDLAKYDDIFNDAPAPAGNDPVTGKVLVEIDRAELTESKAGNPMLLLVLVVRGGPFDGRKLWRRQNLSTKSNMSFLKRDLKTLDITIAKLSDLGGACSKMVGLKVEATVKNKDSGQDIYFDKLVKAAPAVVEDVPF